METQLCIGAPPVELRQQVAAPWSQGLLELADRLRHWLLGGVVIIYLAGINGQWRMEPDSALYLSLARNLATGRGYTYHDKPNAAAYPGLPYALAGIFRVFPSWRADPLNLAVENLLMPLLALATLGLTYRLIRLSAGRPAAVIVTFGVALTRTFYRAAFALMTDMPFLFGVMAFLTGFEGLIRREPKTKTATWCNGLLMLAGGIITIAMRPAWLAFIPVAAIGIGVAGIRGQISWKIAVTAVVLALVAAAVFYAADPRRAPSGHREARYEDQVFHQVRSKEWARFAGLAQANTLDILRQTATSAMLGIKFGPAPDVAADRRWYDHLGAAANIAGAIATLALGVGLFRRRGLWGMWVAATIAMMVAVLPNERYFLQVLPLLIFAWWGGLTWLNCRLPPVAGNIVFAVLLGVGFAPNICHVIGVVIEQRRVPFLAHYRDGKCLALSAAADRISELPADAVILAPDKTARILSYLSGRTVVEQNDYAPDIGWPPASGRVFTLEDPNNSGTGQWLASLGINATRIAPRGATAQMAPLELRRVPRDQLQSHQ